MAKKKFYSTKVESNEPDCESCKLCETCKSPKLKFIGKGKKNVLIIGSQPTSREDLKGELGYGDEAVFLESALEEIGIDFYEDCFYCTTIACRPPRDRKPNATEYMACKPRLEKIIERLEPAGVILLGDIPYSSLIQPMIAKGRMNGITSMDLIGDSIPDQKLGYWVFPTYSIDYLMERKQWEGGKYSDPLYMRDIAIKRYFLNHLKNAFDVVATRSFPRYVTKVEKTTSIDQAIDWIYEAMDWKYLALDYETNCRKPHKEGRIWYASISNGVKTYAFPFFSDPTFVKAWTRLMLTDIGKIAHNDQFENTWTKVRGGGCWINNWIWDTMLGQHCRNNQKKTNLKYCVYASFGIAGYDSEADGYIVPSGADSKKYGGYALNNIHEADPQMAMEYNGLDSLFTAWLYEEQRNGLTEFQLEGMKLLLEASIVMSEVSEAGIPVDEERFDTVNKDLNNALDEAYKEIMEMDDVKQWDGEEPINLGSPKQLSHLLFDILKIKPIGYTDKSKTTPSTDKESLLKMNRPFLKKLIEYREFGKMVSTYIDGWKKETVNGVVHSSFNFNTVDTFRSSSDGPNVQTAYKRDKKKKKIVRSLVKTLPGYCIAEYDYRSLEVIVNGCHSKDPSLKKYCTDPSTDMHRDGGMDIFEMTKEELLDEYRSNVKGLYIFSEFYGNWYGQVAKDLWDYIQETPALLAHMKAKGYRDYATFELHVKECEDLLWGVRFKKHSKWRKEQWAEYQNKGLLVSNTGFHLYGPMRKNNTFNCKVQGDGFHILCHTMINVHKKFKELGLKSHIVNEIHDSLVIMVWPPEEELVDYWVWYYGTVEVMEYWKWITIPLQMEKERSKVDGNWSEMEKCGFVNGGLCLPKV